MWTAERDSELLRLWPEESAREIGKRLGTTRNAVIGRYHRLTGPYPRKRTAAEMEAEMDKKRNRQLRVIAIVEICVEMEAQMARGVPRNEAIRAAKRAGATLQHIGEVLGITRERVRQIVGRVKKPQKLVCS